MIKDAIGKIVSGDKLTADESQKVAEEIMSGVAEPTQIAAFITALRMKGETRENIVGFARVMREKATKIKTPENCIVLDTCGTGGDEMGTFNISTVAAFIAAGAGVKVAKHGNRSVSSKCGSADVLPALGIKIDVPPDVSERSLEEVGICFLFAPLYHKAMKYAIGPRRDIGIRTIFNLVGPLSNPAMATNQLLGVFSAEAAELFAEVLRDLGLRRALVVHGSDGLDEITTTTVTKVTELFLNGEITTRTIEPGEFDLPLVELNDIAAGKDVEENASIIEAILRGAPGPKADIALLNAGAAIYVAEAASSIYEGVERAREIIKSGTALEKLTSFRRFIQQNSSE